MGDTVLSSSAHLFLDEEVPFFTRVHQRTIVMGVEVVSEVPLPAGEYCLWARLSPTPGRLAADAVYTSHPPFILGGFTAVEGQAAGEPGPGVYPVSVGRWQWEPGTRVDLHLAAASARPAAVRAAMANATRRARTSRTRARARAALPEPTTDAELAPLARVRLSGAVDAVVDERARAAWAPLLVHRWLELRHDGPAEATLVYRPPGPPKVEGRPIVSGSAAETYFSLFQGGAKEAGGVDEDRAYVKWVDGSVGLLSELVPYHRVFTPARRERPARVRRFPHRNADVVGVLAFDARAVAIGRRCDPATGEAYALLLLPHDDEALAHLPALYGLASASPSQWIWGWSKIAGTAGLPLLTEVDTAVTGGVPVPLVDGPPPQRAGGLRGPGWPHRAPLPTPTYFTPTRLNKTVRIRRRPTLKSDPIGMVQPNEIKAAAAVVTVGLTAREEGAAATQFVEWAAGGFSVLVNGTQEFLREVRITTEPTSLAQAECPPTNLSKRARDEV